MKPQRLSKTKRDLILSVDREIGRNQRINKELDELEKMRTHKTV